MIGIAKSWISYDIFSYENFRCSSWTSNDGFLKISFQHSSPRNKNFCYEQIINHFTLTGKTIAKTGSIYSVTKTASKQNIMGGIPARHKDTISWRQELRRSNLSIETGSWASNMSLRSLRTIVFHDHLFMFAEAIKWWKPNLIAPSKEFQYNLPCLQCPFFGSVWNKVAS